MSIQFNASSITIPWFRVGEPEPDLSDVLPLMRRVHQAQAQQPQENHKP